MYHELLFTSKAVKELTPQDLIHIHNQGARNNLKNDITGLLLYHNGEFVHLMEGEKQKVQDMCSKILLDKRHTDISLLLQDTTKRKYFENWSIAFQHFEEIDTTQLSNYMKLPDLDHYLSSLRQASPAKSMFLFLTQTILNNNK